MKNIHPWWMVAPVDDEDQSPGDHEEQVQGEQN